MSNVFNVLLTFDDIHILGTFGDIGELTTNPNYSKIDKKIAKTIETKIAYSFQSTTEKKSIIFGWQIP